MSVNKISWKGRRSCGANDYKVLGDANPKVSLKKDLEESRFFSSSVVRVNGFCMGFCVHSLFGDEVPTWEGSRSKNL